MDARKNFAFGTLASGVNSAATSLSVGSGEGARFPATPFNAVIWQATDYGSPAEAYHAGHAEIVRVTGIASDTLTITRAQESTAAVDLNTGGKTYRIEAGPTALHWREVDWGDRSFFRLAEDWVAGVVAGATGWVGRAIGSGSVATVIPGDISAPGIFQERTGTTSGAGHQVGQGGSSTLGGFSGDGTKKFDLSYRFSFTTRQLGARFRAGLTTGGTVAVPTDGVFLRYDVNASFADTTFKLVARSGSTDVAADFGVTPTLDQWYVVRIWCEGGGIIYGQMDSGAIVTISTGLPSANLGIGWHFCTDESSDNRLNLDWFRVFAEVA